MSHAVSEKKMFAGRVLDLNVETHRLPGGRQAEFEIVRHPGGAAILPVLSDGRILLIRQFRPAIGEMIYEIPAGRLEPGEAPGDCAARELREETGYVAGQVLSLGGFWSTPGFCDEYIHLFYARVITGAEPQPEPDEVIELCPMSLEKALALVEAGEVLDSKTLLSLLRYRQISSGE